MVKLIYCSLLILAVLIIAGLPVVLIIFKKFFKQELLEGVQILALALISGFGISAFASSLSYGFFGINTYFGIFILIFIISWTVLLVQFKFKPFANIIFLKMDFLIFIPIIIAIYLSSTQWTSDLQPVLKVGEGPDVPQNIMAAQASSEIGNTWFESRSQIQETLKVNTFEQSAFNLFKLPSASILAAYDYLLYGVRWGLTVPYSQILRYFGADKALLEVGIILIVSLISLVLIGFALGRMLSKKISLALAFSIITITNSTLMQQYLNGGLSQLLGTVSLMGLLIVITLLVQNEKRLDDRKYISGIIVLTTLSIIGSLVTYIDSLLVIFMLVIIFVFLLAFINFKLSRKILGISVKSLLLTLFLIPSAIYANYANLKLRIKAASGTGTAGQNWNFPSVHFGFTNSYAGQILSNFHYIISAIIFILIVSALLFSIFQKYIMREYAALGIASITTVTFGFIISLNSNNKTTYIFDKISIYVTPFLILALFGIAAEYMMHKSKIRNIPLNSLIFFSLLSLIGGVSFVNNYFNIYNKTTVPYAINPVLLSEKIQSDFEKTNFLMPYKPTYNFGPVLGASYWISKAPNDFDLSERKNNQLRLLCFIGDTGCNPITKKIPDSFLESYGIVQFESPLSTEQFMKMTIDEKYKYNFEVFGMEPLLIPDKFKGGNPYYK